MGGMKSAFVARLVNHPFGDPALFVNFRYQGRAILFDLGRIDRLPAGELFRIDQVFVSHTHMDHFIGFDHLLRAFLTRDARIDLFGPPGIIANIEAKLAGYTWNLVDGYPFVLQVHEVSPEKIRSVRMPATTAFRAEELGSRRFNGIIYEDAGWSVFATHLDHRITCLAFAVQEKVRLNVMRDKLLELGLEPQRWLNKLKEAVREGQSDDTPIVAARREGGVCKPVEFTVGELRRSLLIETRGQRVAYVVDSLFSRENARRIIELARGADVLFCESLFLDADRDQAAKRYHLTARQAGTLARLAGVRRLETFHFSPRYERDPAPLRAEAQAVFRGEAPLDEPEC